MFLRDKRHIFTVILHLFTELKVLPSSAIGNKYYGFEWRVKSSFHYVSEAL